MRRHEKQFMDGPLSQALAKLFYVDLASVSDHFIPTSNDVVDSFPLVSSQF